MEDLPREKCGLSRSTRDLQSIEREKCEKQIREKISRDGGQIFDRPTSLSESFLLRDILKGQRKRIFITGDGGIGKTEFTRYLAWELSEPNSHIVPLWFELKRWKDTGDLFKLAAGADAGILKPLAQASRVAFIFDGLDELRYEFADFSLEFERLISRFPNCAFILAGRLGSLGDLYKHGFTKQAQHLIEPLCATDIDRYIRGYFGITGDASEGEELIVAMRYSGLVMHSLLRQPFMLALTCRIHGRGNIKIDNRLNDPAGLVEDGLGEIFARRREDDVGNRTGRLKLSDDKCLASLSALAAHSSGNFYEVDRNKAIQVLQRHAGAGSPGIARARLAKLAPYSGVLVRTDDRNYRFTNRVIAEFLAARWIVSYGYPERLYESQLPLNENPSDQSILDFLSDYIWSIRHRELAQAVNFELARRKPELLIRFINWLAATLRQQFTGHADDLDLKWTLFGRVCRALNACRNPRVSATLLVQFQPILHHFVSPSKNWFSDDLFVETISWLPDLLRASYLKELILRVRASPRSGEQLDLIGDFVDVLAPGSENDLDVHLAVLEQVRFWLQPAEHGFAKEVKDTTTSDFANDVDIRQALLEKLRAYRDPKEFCCEISDLANTLASRFAKDTDVRQALLEKLRDCYNLIGSRIRN